MSWQRPQLNLTSGPHAELGTLIVADTDQQLLVFAGSIKDHPVQVMIVGGAGANFIF